MVRESSGQHANKISFFDENAKKVFRTYQARPMPLDPHFGVGASDPETVIKRSGRLLGILGTTMESTTSSLPHSNSAILLFDTNGTLLEIYGGQELRNQLDLDGIRFYSLWRMENLGPNAITVGLREHIHLYTVGAENSVPILEKYGIYFIPLQVEPSPRAWVNTLFDTTAYGGLALISFERQFNPDHAFLLSTIHHSLVMTLHSKQLSYGHYESLNEGVIIINFVLRNGQEIPVITFFNSKLAELFSFPGEDIMFRQAQAVDAAELIDPPPQNQEFWRVLEAQERLDNCPLTLSVSGRAREYMVSSVPFYQPTLGVRGLRLHITAPRCSGPSAPKGREISAFDAVVGQSPAIKYAIQRGKLMARTGSNIMICGESGTGKEVFARAIHFSSLRRSKPFVAVNCGALPRELVASELFGYESGAFTGANRHGKMGKFELANGGTIFLDEIGECPLDIQAALLRVVEQKQFMRVGGTEQISVDVRIISATNADLQSMILQKTFREDLYYRLATMRLALPPLRDRGEDIVDIANHFIRKYSVKLGKEQLAVLSPSAEEALRRHSWRGNIRELQNVMECIISFYDDPVISAQHILENFEPEQAAPPPPAAEEPPEDTPPRGMLKKEDIQHALDVCGGNRSAAAKYLGIARKTLYRNMERLSM